MGLRRPADYRPQGGARFEVHVEKSRGFVGDAGKPFEVRLAPTADGCALTWSAHDLKPNHLDEAAALFRAGVTVRDVAAQLGITKSSAGRLRMKAREDGLLDIVDGGGEEDDGGTVH
jgi:putative DNA primase/helicase